jgi:hypothetical protein
VYNLADSDLEGSVRGGYEDAMAYQYNTLIRLLAVGRSGRMPSKDSDNALLSATIAHARATKERTRRRLDDS